MACGYVVCVVWCGVVCAFSGLWCVCAMLGVTKYQSNILRNIITFAGIK